MSETKLAFSFKDQDFMDFLPENQLDQLRSRWTDFNIHDPGVTTFEALQFSFEDLNYRYELGIKDLLQGEEKNALNAWGKRDFRPRYAVSKDDYRRLLCRNRGIINNMVFPTTTPNILPDTEQLKCLVNADMVSFGNVDKEAAQKHLLNRRALGEYINRQKESDTFLREKVVPIDVRMTVAFVAGGETQANIQTLRKAILDYLLPKLTRVNTRFTSVRDLLNHHNQLGAIGNGAVRDLVDSESMAKPCYRRYIPVSEIFETLQDLDFILNSQSIEIAISGGFFKSSVLDLGDESFTQLESFTLNEVVIDDLSTSTIPEPLRPWDTFSGVGKYKQLSEFNSVQLSFPPNYKIGHYLGNEKKLFEEGKQEKCTYSFRGYLYFMDKIRADISAQMENFHNVFEMDGNSCDIAAADISGTPFYADLFPKESNSLVVGIEFEGESDRRDTDETFLLERVNYLLALNGWAIIDEIPSMKKDISLLQIKMDFLKLIRLGARRSDKINAHLNRIFKATSLIMLQRKIEVVLQNDVSDVRILEHCFFQPVWTGAEDFNFEITLFLFSKTPTEENERSPENIMEFAQQLVRNLVPAHIVVNLKWLNEDIRNFDGYLQTAFPPKEFFYFDAPLAAGQKYAMEHILSTWLGINA